MSHGSILDTLKDNNSRIGFVIGDAGDNQQALPYFDCGRVTGSTDSGKTLITESGIVFKYRWRQGKHAIQGNPNTTMIVIQEAPKS